jgi:ABC-type cobalamin/Fe3+-siderophores transport system ATPase subunit
MVRTQIQLTEKQAVLLQQQAAEEGTSVAELIRRGVDLYLQSCGSVSDEERRHRALRAAGRFASGKRDLSERHDDYLAEAYR